MTKPMHTGRKTTFISEGEAKRLDLYIAGHIPDLTRSAIKGLVEKGLVLVNGVRAKAGARLKPGDAVSVTVPEPPAHALKALEPENIPLDIIYEDSDIIVVNKSAGIAVHPGAGRRSGTLVNALLNHTTRLSSAGGGQRPGIVHRLDMDTTGVLVVAKNDASHANLSEQFKEHTTTRKYTALVWGVMKDDTGEIDLPLGRSPSDRTKISPRARRKRKAVTAFRVLKRYPGLSLLELMPRTGRTHQIRVHLSAMNRPIVGDGTYGGVKKLIPSALEGPPADGLKKAGRQCLHAGVLGIKHPKTGEYMEFSAPLPPDMGDLIKSLDEKFS